MKRLSLQWRITLMSVLLIGITCVAMNLLLCSSCLLYTSNPILNIVAFCATHGKEAAAIQLEDLAAHQVQHMGANAVHLAAVPLCYGVSFQCVIVFMVAADEGKREGQTFQASHILWLLQ